jgi:hypothetical protein
MPNADSEPRLPPCWQRPVPVKSVQRTFFVQSTEEALVELSVSRDEVRLWRQKEWISFDIDAEKELEDPLKWEVEFIRNLARSGLSDAHINRHLRELPKPYRLDPSKTAFHFLHGWVTPRTVDPFDVIEEQLDDWLNCLVDEGCQSRLMQIAGHIAELLNPNGEEDGEEEE